MKASSNNKQREIWIECLVFENWKMKNVCVRVFVCHMNCRLQNYAQR